MATVEEIDDNADAGKEVAEEEEIPNLENQDGPKLNRGEKKCRKALMKLGMKQFAGITRVTMRRRDGGIFVINDPEVLRSTEGDGNSFVCFGQIEVDSPEKRMMEQQVNAMKAKEEALKNNN